ncbi:Uu.00g108210.m01.CDS01 [Anthostomella pinea]|uniref:Uu.00g108210.m01.CDS01 n=1 Tax=Anthostomella pinea TaxID=933095 RepID=A0AAI8VFI3_9PEZI|nr:Uu.00g108210.m01.CDS01 [Anthostomella pinea]
MAIIELAYPQLKKDAELIRAAEPEMIPLILKALQEAGAVNGLRGFIHSEDGRDVTTDVREVLLLEWPSASKFRDFLTSPLYLEFAERIKSVSDGPPIFKLHETSDSSKLFGSDTILEVLEIRPNERVTEEDVQGILHTVQSGFEKLNSPKAVYGSSLNLDKKEVVVIGVFANDAELDAAQVASSRPEMLAHVGGSAMVTRLIAHVGRVPL